MTVTVKVIYAADRSFSEVEGIPTTSTVGKLKELIARINKMSSTDPIRLVQGGIVLDNATRIGALTQSGNARPVVVYATGVANKARPAAGPPGAARQMNLRGFYATHKTLVQGLVGLVLLLGGVCLLALWSLKPAVHVRSASHGVLKLFIGVAVALVIGVIGIGRLCKWNPPLILECAKMYGLSLIPTFDVAKFKADHQIA
jgi:hypothetical protein